MNQEERERIRQEVLIRLEATKEFEETADKEASEQEKPLLYWRIFITFVGIVGLLLLTVLQVHDRVLEVLPSAIGKTPVRDWNLILAILLLGFALVNLTLYLVMRRVVDWILGRRAKPVPEWPPLLVGFAEALLYPISLLAGHPELIGAWLVLKVAGQWELWAKGQEGRLRFNRFLVGNALSILLNAGTYGTIRLFAMGTQRSWLR